MNRHHLLATMGALAATSAARPVRAQTLQTIHVGAFVADATGPVLYAVDKGFFKSHGLDGQFVVQSSGSAGAAAMVGGSVDIVSIDTVSLAKAHENGQAFLLLAPSAIHSAQYPALGLVLNPGTTPTDLNGKTLGTNALGNLAVVTVNSWLDRNGGDSRKVKWVEFPFPAMQAALQRGVIDGFCAPEPFLALSDKAGLPVNYLARNPLAPILLTGGWIATKDWITQNAATARAFVAAIRDASNWANVNPKESAEIISKYSKIPAEAIEATKRAKFVDKLDPATLQPLIDATAHYGFMSRTFPARDIIATL